VVQRVKSPYPSTQDARYEQVLRRRVAALMETGGPVSPLLNAEAVRERLATPVGANSGMATRMRFEQVLALDSWLGDYGITVDV
jgi:asparagine synthase (glutamine-hydrolysing)